jgi:hypothetical protein
MRAQGTDAVILHCNNKFACGSHLLVSAVVWAPWARDMAASCRRRRTSDGDSERI